jgi:hypothetical protein
MLSEILMNREEWVAHYNLIIELVANEPKMLLRVERLNKNALSHFDRDYTKCRASVEMNSPVVDQLVTFWSFRRDRNERKLKTPRSRAFSLTLHVIFENDESLSHTEALKGLGDIAPKLLQKKVERMHERRIRHERRSDSGYFNFTL